VEQEMRLQYIRETDPTKQRTLLHSMHARLCEYLP